MLDVALWTFGPIVFLVVLIGLGDPLIPRDARLPVARSAAAAITGMLVLAAVVPIFNIFFPLGIRPAGVTFAFGLGGAVLALRRGTLDRTALNELILASIVAGAVYRASSFVIPIRLFTDTVLYHLAHMEWLARSAMPLGTANIQTRLGFNPGFMTIASAFRWESLGVSHLFLLEVAIRAIFLLVVLSAIRERGRQRTLASTRLQSLAIGVAIAAIPFFAINKSGTDGNVGFLVLVAAIIAVATSSRGDIEERSDGLLLLIATIALVTTFKLSAATSVVLAGPLLIGRGRVPTSALLRTIRSRVSLFLFAVVAVGGWGVRGFAITGCFAFPAAGTCVPVSWGIGPDVAGAVSAHTTEFARRTTLTGTTVDWLDVSWIGAWLPSHLTSVPALVVLAALPVAALARVRQQGRPFAWTIVLIAALPATLTVLSLADLLGGHRFLGVDPTLAGTFEDYPNVEVLLLLPIVGLFALMALAALAPRREPHPSQRTTITGESRPHGPMRLLAPFLLVTSAYWLLVAPAARFAWATHVLFAGLLLSSWVGTVDLARLRRVRPRRAALLGGSIGLVVLAGFGLTSPVLPIKSPDVAPLATIPLPPDGREVFIPPDVEGCAQLFPCAPTPPSGVQFTDGFGRPVFKTTEPSRERLLRELSIIR